MRPRCLATTISEPPVSSCGRPLALTAIALVSGALLVHLAMLLAWTPPGPAVRSVHSSMTSATEDAPGGHPGDRDVPAVPHLMLQTCLVATSAMGVHLLLGRARGPGPGVPSTTAPLRYDPLRRPRAHAPARRPTRVQAGVVLRT